jgi:hypothetical protein
LLLPRDGVYCVIFFRVCHVWREYTLKLSSNRMLASFGMIYLMLIS